VFESLYGEELFIPIDREYIFLVKSSRRKHRVLEIFIGKTPLKMNQKPFSNETV